jgi:large subunit ribosomal protein L29
MRTQEIRDLDDQKIAEQIANFRKELFGLRFQQATGELENTAALRTTRRDLARAVTIARQRGIDVNEIR